MAKKRGAGQDAYYDGILWIELGPQHEEMRIVAKIQDLLVVLNGEAPALRSVDAAASKLADAIGDRRLLIVIDDVWSERALEPFLVRAPNCTRIVTSQTHLTPSKRLEDHLIGQMKIDEGLALLQSSLSSPPSKRFNETASKVLVRIGHWPQLIKLVGGFIRSRVIDAHQTPDIAIADAMSRLDSRGLTAFDGGRQQGYADRHMAVGAVINLIMNLLTDQEQARLRALVVFVPGTFVPVDLASKFWGATQALDQIASEDFLLRLQSLSLLSDLDFGLRHFRMGDLVREFILDQISSDDLLSLHMTSRPIREVRVTAGEVHRMKVLSPQQIVMSTTDGEILLMSASDGAVEMRFEPGDSVLSAFSDVFDGEFLCGSGFSGEAMVRGYSLDRLNNLVEKEQVDQEIAAIRFQKIPEPEPSGNWAWDAACNFHTDDVVSVAWLTNELVVSAAMDRTLKIWNADTFEEVALFRGDLAFFDLKLDLELGQIFARDRDDRYHVFEYVRGREAVAKAAKRWS